jgi:hypothetical protein
LDAFSDLPTYTWIAWSLFLVIAISSIVVQAMTLSKLNLSAIYLGCCFTLIALGFMFGTHEFGRALGVSTQISNPLQQHIVLADGAAVSFTIICFFTLTSLILGLIGGLLAYLREWIYREGAQQ